MYYTVIKYDGHLRTRGKCRKHELQASVFSHLFSLKYRFYTRKTIKHAFSMFYLTIRLRADSQRGAVELTIARIKRGRVV